MKKHGKSALLIALLLATSHVSMAQGRPQGKPAPDSGEDKSFRILLVKHIYVGGIASVFKGAGVIATAPFISPGYNNSNGNQNGGGFGGGSLFRRR